MSIITFEKKKPQDGRFTAAYAKRAFDFRVSLIPTLDGERVAITILNKSSRLLNIHDLGLSSENLSKVQSKNKWSAKSQPKYLI